MPPECPCPRILGRLSPGGTPEHPASLDPCCAPGTPWASRGGQGRKGFFLMEWFNHIKIEHEDLNPDQQDANQEYILYFHQVSRNLDISRDCLPVFRELLSRYFPDPPIYSCPTCRAHALSPPIVVFALKDLICTVAVASFEAGDNSFSQDEYIRWQNQSQGSASAWDKFFAKRPTSI